MERYIKDIISNMDMDIIRNNKAEAIEILSGLNDGKRIDTYIIGDRLFNGMVSKYDLAKEAVSKHLFIQWYLLTKMGELVKTGGELNNFATACYVLYTTIDKEYIADIFNVEISKLDEQLRYIFGTANIADIRYNAKDVVKYCAYYIREFILEFDVETRIWYAIYLCLMGYRMSNIVQLTGSGSSNVLYRYFSETVNETSINDIKANREKYIGKALDAYTRVMNVISHTPRWKVCASLIDAFNFELAISETSTDYHTKEVFMGDLETVSKKLLMQIRKRFDKVLYEDGNRLLGEVEVSLNTDIKILRYMGEHCK